MLASPLVHADVLYDNGQALPQGDRPELAVSSSLSLAASYQKAASPPLHILKLPRRGGRGEARAEPKRLDPGPGSACGEHWPPGLPGARASIPSKAPRPDDEHGSHCTFYG